MTPSDPSDPATDRPIVVARIPDLMAEVRFTQAMLAAGVQARIVSPDDWVTVLTDGPTLAVVDLVPDGAIEAIETAAAAGVPVLAYGPHVDERMLDAARQAGAAQVVTRGRFTNDAAGLVQRLLAESGDR